MTLRLRALEAHVPDVVARAAVRRLFAATSSAFGCRPLDLRGSDLPALLERYARFTSACAERALDDGHDLERISGSMWTNGHALGRSLRRRLGVRTLGEALRAARVAYAIIGIDLRVDPGGRVIVDRCAFADRYSPRTCGLMSSLDAGLIAGLTSGGRLSFSERITEGSQRCLARISWQAGRV